MSTYVKRCSMREYSFLTDRLSRCSDTLLDIPGFNLPSFAGRRGRELPFSRLFSRYTASKDFSVLFCQGFMSAEPASFVFSFIVGSGGIPCLATHSCGMSPQMLWQYTLAVSPVSHLTGWVRKGLLKSALCPKVACIVNPVRCSLADGLAEVCLIW